MNPTTSNIPLVLKVLHIEDENINIVNLPYGVFEVDGQVVSNTSYNSYNNQIKISAKDVNNIRKITTEKILVKYQDSEGFDLDVVEYENIRLHLLSKSSYNEDTEEYDWQTLEDEFAYRKFAQKWNPIYKEVLTYSDPLLVDKSSIKLDTGNPFITSGFSTCQADATVYTYSRSGAVAHLLEKKFESLGMEFKGNINYGATEGKKVWGNSPHSGLEYVTAFGKYIIGKDMVKRTQGSFNGTLEKLQKMYEEDKEWIENHIQALYNLHFRDSGASSVLLSEVVKGVKQAITYVNTVDVKVKSETSKRSALNVLNKLLDLANKEALEK